MTVLQLSVKTRWIFCSIISPTERMKDVHHFEKSWWEVFAIYPQAVVFTWVSYLVKSDRFKNRERVSWSVRFFFLGELHNLFENKFCLKSSSTLFTYEWICPPETGHLISLDFHMICDFFSHLILISCLILKKEAWIQSCWHKLKLLKEPERVEQLFKNGRFLFFFFYPSVDKHDFSLKINLAVLQSCTRSLQLSAAN